MSTPIPAQSLLVRPEAVAGLAEELAGLAAELSEDADRCRSTAGWLSTALSGDEGWTAGAAVAGWGGLETILAEQTAALAATLSAAVQAYLEHDARLAGGMEPRRTGVPR